MNFKNILMPLIGVLVIAGAVYLVWAGFMKTPLITENNNNNGGTACTADAMQCSDGSWVGRSGPNCEFACPASTSSLSSVFLQTKINQGMSGLDVKVVPLELVEDSRCPTDVQCIQAGTVRVRALLTSGLGTAAQVFTLNAPVTTENEIITLVDVMPVKVSTQSISASEYRFTFKVEKR